MTLPAGFIIEADQDDKGRSILKVSLEGPLPPPLSMVPGFERLRIGVPLDLATAEQMGRDLMVVSTVCRLHEHLTAELGEQGIDALTIALIGEGVRRRMAAAGEGEYAVPQDVVDREANDGND